jgi:hypothetical protein
MIKRLVNKLISTAKKVGLIVNDDKKEYLIVNSRNRNCGQEYIKIEEHSFKIVSQFKYQILF